MMKDCKVGEKSKNRVTVAFIVSAAGKAETLPIVIGSSANPRCFKTIKKGKLPVLYFSQDKSGEILNEVLKSLNSKLKAQGRSIL